MNLEELRTELHRLNCHIEAAVNDANRAMLHRCRLEAERSRLLLMETVVQNRDVVEEPLPAPHTGNGAAVAPNGANKTTSKSQMLRQMLVQGTTVADMVKATGWRYVAPSYWAKIHGLTLAKTRRDGANFFKAVPAMNGHAD